MFPLSEKSKMARISKTCLLLLFLASFIMQLR